MPWNGNGVFQRTDGTRSGATVWVQAKAAGVRIREDHHDTHDEDIASGIEACLNRDGENSPTTNINWGGFKITNLAAGSSDGDAVAYDQASVRFTSTDAGASAGPTITLYRNSASPANEDALGLVEFRGEDSAGNEQLYASIFAEIADVTSASEDARIKFNTVVAGTERTVFRLTANGTAQFSSYDDGEAAGPVVTLHRDTTTPADAGVIGGINFDGEDDGSTQTTYASIAAVMDDVTNATEDGHFKVQAVRAGSLVGCTGPGILQGLVTTTGGTAIDFTGIHADARRITVTFSLSTNGTDRIILQLGDSGGLETDGYDSTAGVADSLITSGFALNAGSSAAVTFVGVLVLTMHNPALNHWFAHGTFLASSGGNAPLVGNKALSGTLDRLRITTTGGTHTFDVVTVNVMVE